MPDGKPARTQIVPPATDPPPDTPSVGHTSPAAGGDVPVPDKVGPYRVLGLLGRGGMGVVYRAEDRSLGREVAVKVMVASLSANPDARTRFIREAQAQARLEHDHVVPIYRIGQDGGVPFIAMPLLRGRTLADHLTGGRRVPVPEAVRIAREIAAGLAAAHAVGLIHRDVKPANVWLEGDRRRVKLLDFGLARVATGSPETDPLTASGVLLGTPAYMAPEQARGQPVDARVDLWSLGVILYQMATGVMPFRGADPLSVLSALIGEPPTPPAVVNAAIPPELDDLISRLLAKAASARPPTAAVVVAELARIEASLGEPAATAVTGVTRWPVTRRQAAWAAGGLAGLALIGVVVARPWASAPPVAVAAPAVTSAPPAPGPVAAPVPGTASAPVPGPSPRPAADRFADERPVAELLHPFCKLWLVQPDGRTDYELTPDKPLPDGPVQVTGVFTAGIISAGVAERRAAFWQAASTVRKLRMVGDWTNAFGLTVTDLPRLAALPSAPELAYLVGHFRLGDRDLAALAWFPKLKAFGYAGRAPGVLAGLPQAAPNLTELRVIWYQNRDAALSLPEATAVASLKLTELDAHVDDPAVAAVVADIRTVRTLDVQVSGPRADACLRAIAVRSKARRMVVRGDFTAAAVAAVAEMTDLRTLELKDAPDGTAAAVRAAVADRPRLRVEWPGGAVGPPSK